MFSHSFLTQFIPCLTQKIIILRSQFTAVNTLFKMQSCQASCFWHKAHAFGCCVVPLSHREMSLKSSKISVKDLNNPNLQDNLHICLMVLCWDWLIRKPGIWFFVLDSTNQILAPHLILNDYSASYAPKHFKLNIIILEILSHTCVRNSGIVWHSMTDFSCSVMWNMRGTIYVLYKQDLDCVRQHKYIKSNLKPS